MSYPVLEINSVALLCRIGLLVLFWIRGIKIEFLLFVVGYEAPTDTGFHAVLGTSTLDYSHRILTPARAKIGGPTLTVGLLAILIPELVNFSTAANHSTPRPRRLA